MPRPRRTRAALERAVEAANSPSNRALACYELALFHDNNGREAEAITHYRRALALGLDGGTEARALSWLASSLYKTGQPAEALGTVKQARALASDLDLTRFLDGLERRVRRHGDSAGR